MGIALATKFGRLENTLAVMWESRYVFRSTKAALAAPELQKDFDKVSDAF